MALQIIPNWKKCLKSFVLKAAPYSHFVPASLRHKVSAAMLEAAKPRRFHKPLPYLAGRFPNGVNLYGFFRAENGLAQGTKLYASALEASGLPYCFLNTDFLDWLPQEDMSFDSRLTCKPRYAINVIHINPDQWEEACISFPAEHFDHHYNIGVWLWELETIPREWIPCFENVDELWAPSAFIAEALRKESPVPVTLMPYGISAPCDAHLTRTDFGLPKDQFLVLTMYDSNSYSSRKNPGAAMHAFKEAFPNRKDKATLVIKVNNPKYEDLAFIRETMGENTYVLFTERMDKPRLNALIRLCDVFISLHRSEGFGLVMAEAMALRTPVVATNWSSNTEFMDQDACCMVNYTLIPVNNAYQYGQQEHRWADADVHQAAGYLRRLRDDPTYYQHKADSGYRKITTSFSVEHTAKKMACRIRTILGQGTSEEVSV